MQSEIFKITILNQIHSIQFKVTISDMFEKCHIKRFYDNNTYIFKDLTKL